MNALHQTDVDRVRLQLAAFVLPRPDQVSAADVTMRRGDGSRIVPAASSPDDIGRDAAAATSPLASATLRSRIREALARGIADPAGPRAARPWASRSDGDAHDGYFRIERTDATGELDYLEGVVGGLDLFLREVESTGELQDYEGIGLAMLDLWSAGVGERGCPAAAPPPAEMMQRAPEPVRRWVRGHQLFAVLTQGLIWTLQRFEQASLDDDEAALRESLQRMTRLYRASAATFRFTADFDPAVYEDTIRPSMSEPHLPPGFSGTLSVDHGHLVGRLKALAEPLAAARLRCPADYAAMTAALTQVYDDHKWVCARFTGASAASLLTGSVGGDRSALDMLDRFKARRVGTLLA